MDDVFNTPPGNEEGQGETRQTEQQHQQVEQAAQEQQSGEQGAAPPVAQDTKHVPLEALEAERKGRQDWKEKATRFEERARALEEQLARTQQPQQGQQQQDPLQVMQQQIVNERFNTSEMLVREKFQDVDDVIGTFKEAAAANPALIAQMHAHPHPWKFAYEEGKRLRFAAEIGNDPEAYRKKLRAEIEAELKAQGAPQSQQPGAPALPQSLAGARSAGARGNTWTGPTPLDSMFNN
jgi:hypothetical protein